MILILLCSCSKEEYNTLTPLTDENSRDTIIIDDTVIESTNGVSTTYRAISTSCPDPQGISGTTTTHYLAYGPDLVIENGEAVYEEAIYVLLWKMPTGEVQTGTYLAEGTLVFPNGIEEVRFCVRLNITAVTSISISGNFSTVESSPLQFSGIFSTSVYSCAALGLENELELNYTDGRLYSIINEETTIPLMSATRVCDGLFLDQFGTSRFIFGGGKLLVDAGDSLVREEEARFMIHLDMRENYTFNQTLKAFYFEEIPELANGVGSFMSYQNFVEIASEISVTISSEEQGYLYGSYIGILKDGRRVEGNFISEIATNC